MADAITPAATTATEPITFEAALAEQRRAERLLVRYAALGIAIGAVVCAAIWTGLVWLALEIADSSISTGPALAMSAVVGVFAGAFYGGWAGTVAGNIAIERAEMAAEAEEHAHAH